MSCRVYLGEGQSYTESQSTWSLPQTLTGLAVVLSVYLTLVLKILPDYMKNRAPYKLNKILSIYNAFQVAYSTYLVFIYTRYMLRHGVITTRCPTGQDLQGVISEILPYFVAKHLDFLDTIFFVLRKKDNQISFLHLYHHTAMASWTWLHYFYHPTDHFVVVGLLNSFVHVLMYAYYGISSMGPEYAKYVWWKKHLTKVQLIQFILVVSDLHYQQKLTPCKIPTFFHYFCMFSIGSFFFLFLNFYFRSYRTRRSKKELEVKGKETLNLECSVKAR
ncbi:elongation of very long chain fatty acids protein 7-like isoform X2 [Pectinophora gossypiella]|uniref:elongation of very long chain fatty acids protein 7-like isoform X2 n=1 Tax=Pectinophora gossypiella TaxID=13191 RepID=UPI00214F4CEB|nr:elongation of very long chain fatty acids protein 7-like isoform X2 [Pectinophora gossypiella]